MRVRKEVLVTILFLLPIHTTVGKLKPTTLGVSILNWAIGIRNILKTGSADKYGLWDDGFNALKSLNVLFDKSIKSLLNELEEIEKAEDHLQVRFKKGNVELSQWILRNQSITQKVLKLGSHLEAIDRIADELQNLKIFDFVIPQQLCKWANVIVEKERMTKEIDRIYSESSSGRDSLSLRNLVRSLLKNAVNDNSRCGQGYSPYDYLHTIYDLVMVAEMRGYVVEAFAHYLLSTYNGTTVTCEYLRGNWETELETLYKRLRAHVGVYNELFISGLEHLSREFRACDDDSKSFQRDETYLELEGAMQRYLHAYDPASSALSSGHLDCSLLDRRYRSKSCGVISNSCSAPLKYPCMGYMTDCEAVSSADVLACIASVRPRRYEWINKTNGEPVRGCKTQTFQKGTTCLCTCIDNDVNSMSTHLFNLQPVEADVANDMVVTGIRFIVHNGVLQFQIQQGKLGNYWAIEGSPAWKPINDISEKIRAKRLGRKLRGELPGVEEGRDYLIVKEGTGLQLDALLVPKGHVLTGVKFDLVPKTAQNSPQRVQIAVLSRPFNVTSGMLSNIGNEPNVVRSDIVDRKKFVYPKKNVLSPLPANYFSGLNQWVSITTSNVKIDWGQTTLPYFDAKPVISDPPSALGGLGIFHKYGGNFTGFVALKCISIDYGHFMNENNVFPLEAKIDEKLAEEIRILEG
ncbi:uncharacterized protein LOC107048065 [Diachasma alloeum]|uniref:uncharacterized protein LOC107048065 n=1 Tax=Diachasma alloeum TaxID=454923 RepID=UPI00073823D8|nr:uncharacterized protein LOC107048065 [Diachasma alloeum]